MITVSIFGVVVIIFILHTVVTHLINWWFRETDDDSELYVVVSFTIVELISITALLDYYTN